MLRLASFPNCCSAQILLGFFGPVDEIKEAILAKVPRMESSSMNLAILTGDLMEKYGPTLKEIGFEVIAEGESIHNYAFEGRAKIFLLRYDGSKGSK